MGTSQIPPPIPSVQYVLHAVATGRKEHDQAICQGWQQPSLEQDLEAKSSAIELIGPRSTREEIWGVYNDVY